MIEDKTNINTNLAQEIKPLKKKIRRIGLLVLVLTFTVLAVYLYNTDLTMKKGIGKAPKKPKVEVPEVYKTGWWTMQKHFVVEKFEVQIIESNLSLLNNKSLISYTIEGQLSSEKEYKAYIKQVHLSERYCNDSLKEYDRIIEITPVIDMKKKKNQLEESTPTTLTNEYLISSINWGVNKVLFVCGKHQKIIELFQRK